MSKIIESLRGDLATLHDAGAIGKVTMRQFDAICPPPVRAFGASDIKRLRESLKFSQPVFALHLHTSVSTVRKWEQGETHPVSSTQVTECDCRQGIAGYYLTFART